MGLGTINDPNKSDIIELKNIVQKYGKGDKEITVINDLNFLLEREPQVDGSKHGKRVSLIGLSGCGKSTLLRYIAGLQTPTSGKVLLDGKPISEKQSVGMVFQKYSSLEWRSVLDNVAFGLELQGVDKEIRYKKAMEIIEMVGLLGHENKFAQYPSLSGGQLQRVAIARSLLASPNILLMDEPFSGLDVKTKFHMQDMLIDIWNKIHPTIITVTHDITEAVYLSDEIIILNKGNIVHKIETNFSVAERNRKLKLESKFIDIVKFVENKIFELEE